jgi:diguanylate cyclase (GGDEF)-like protein
LHAFAAADAPLVEAGLLSALLELAETGCAVLDTASGVVLAANAAARRLLGSELQGLPAMRLLAGPGRGRQLKTWRSDLDNQPQGSWQVELRRCNGQRLPVTMAYQQLEAGRRSLLLLSLRQAPLVQRLHEELEVVRQELRRSNSLDELTGLPNRAACSQRLASLLREGPQPHQVAVLDLDVDEFQTINESFGMTTGNRLLTTLAERLRESLAPGDLVGRIGSDEFLVVRSGIGSAREASTLAEELQQRLGAPHRLDQHFSVRAPVSVGVSVGPLHSGNADGLLQCANTALAAAKQRGRQQLEVYSSELSQRIQERLQLEQELARAIDRHQLRLDYQPQVDGSGRLVGAEALLRWRNSRGETIPPARFIPLAEATGLIVAIGAWVVEEGLRQLAEWQRQGLNLPRLALNLSPRQFNSSETRLLEIVEAACRNLRLDPAGVEFELTETVFQGDLTLVKHQLEALAGQGFKLAIDDFGTGYSSLGMLHQLPLNTLKIDRCFVHDLVAHGPGRSIVGATLAMAGQLGLTTVAEGVETGEQLRQLLELGCCQFQGFLFSRPLPAKDLGDLLGRPSEPLLAPALRAAG